MCTTYIYSKDCGINLSFVKANSYLIKKHKLYNESSNTDSQELYNKLRLLWKQEYKIDIDQQWTTLTFSNKKVLELFLLRWS